MSDSIAVSVVTDSTVTRFGALKRVCKSRKKSLLGKKKIAYSCELKVFGTERERVNYSEARSRLGPGVEGKGGVNVSSQVEPEKEKVNVSLERSSQQKEQRIVKLYPNAVKVLPTLPHVSVPSQQICLPTTGRTAVGAWKPVKKGY